MSFCCFIYGRKLSCSREGAVLCNSSGGGRLHYAEEKGVREGNKGRKSSPGGKDKANPARAGTLVYGCGYNFE